MAATHLLFFGLLWMLHCNGYFPVSTNIETCCADPVNAFILREFSGDCACQTLQQKWKRYVDWVQIEGGYIHPDIEMNYVGRYQDSVEFHSKETRFRMHSHERGMFVNLRDKYIRKLEPKALLMQIPFSITFSQFIISKYIKNAAQPTISNPHIKQILFSKTNHFMPDDFPDWRAFVAVSKKTYHVASIRGWLALGLAWLKQNTRELLPWLELLPSPYYLPITWDPFVRDEILLKGSRASLVIESLQREYNSALPYVDLLGLTRTQLKESFAWISSRSFGMNFESVGGATKSPAVPCGIDFINHDVFGDSSIYYDSSFGEDRFLYHGHKQKQSYEIVENLISSNKGNVSVREIDFASSYLWLHEAFANTSELFVNYGKQHTSASRLALFGFIDEIHPYDYYPIHLNVLQSDWNANIKKYYFKTVWNDTYIHLNNHKKGICYSTVHAHGLSASWYELGSKPTRYQNYNKALEEQRVFAPPLEMQYYAQNVLKVKGNFLRFLRLIFLPQQHFDSFTISAILNDFEYDYIRNVIDPLIEQTLNDICSALLRRYPTTYIEDEIELQEIEWDRNYVLSALELNRNRNLTETLRLSQQLSILDRASLVLQYRVREKTFLYKCTRMSFEPTQQYLNKFRKTKKPKIESVDTFQQLLSAALDLSSFISFDAMNNSNETDSVNVRLQNISLNIDHSELERQAHNLLESVDIDLDIFEDEESEEILTELIRQATQSMLDDLDSDLDEDSIDVMTENEDKERKETQIVQSASHKVSIEQLVIGETKKARQTLAETIGWNSPKAGIGKHNAQQQNIAFTNANGAALDLSALFGGNNMHTFTISGGNIQINNGQIVIGDNAQVQIDGNNNLNNALNPLVVNVNNQQQEIPETVPFSQLMSHSTTVSIVSLDGNGNVLNVGNALSTNNLAQLLNRKKEELKP